MSPHLNSPQRRLLTEVLEGKREFNGRVLRTAQKLEKLGLIRITAQAKRPNRITGGRDWAITLEPL